MKWFVKRFVMLDDGSIHDPIGSSYQIFIRDLKTLRGVLNRVRSWNNKGIAKIEVYAYTNVFDKSTYKLVHTISYEKQERRY